MFQIGLPDPSRRRIVRRFNLKSQTSHFQKSTFCLKSWFILPDSFTDSLHIELCAYSTSLKNAYAYAEQMDEFDTPFKSKFSLPFRIHNPFVASIDRVEQFKKAIRINIWCRKQFRRLYVRWRLRRFKRVNENDPITLELPVDPVTLYDWSTFCIYVYDAKTLLRDITEKMLHRDEMFSMACVPRNPLTNGEFTCGQLCGIVEQLRAYKRTNWVIEGYAKCSFDHEHFKSVYSIPLNKSALLRFFSDIKSFDLNETLLDFIEAQHQIHNVQYNKNLYKWGVFKAPMNRRISAWRNLCYKYYLNSILYCGDANLLALRHTADIYYPSLRLCSMAKDIYQERMMGQYQ